MCVWQGLTLVQTDFELTILLSQPPECWDYGHKPPVQLLVIQLWVVGQVRVCMWSSPEAAAEWP